MFIRSAFLILSSALIAVDIFQLRYTCSEIAVFPIGFFRFWTLFVVLYCYLKLRKIEKRGGKNNEDNDTPLWFPYAENSRAVLAKKYSYDTASYKNEYEIVYGVLKIALFLRHQMSDRYALYVFNLNFFDAPVRRNKFFIYVIIG